MKDIFEVTGRWFVVARQQPNEPTYDPKQVCFYLGMQVEELAEKLELLAGGFAVEELRQLADTFKASPAELVRAIDTKLRSSPQVAAEWLDADCDQIWVTLGAMRALGANSELAYSTVAVANWDKFPDGRADLDPNGKVIKPQGWVAPNLVPSLPPELKGIK